MLSTLFGVFAVVALVVCAGFVVWLVCGVEADAAEHRSGQIAEPCTCVRDRSEVDVRDEVGRSR